MANASRYEEPIRHDSMHSSHPRLTYAKELDRDLNQEEDQKGKVDDREVQVVLRDGVRLTTQGDPSIVLLLAV